MNGTKRLRCLAGAWDEWGLGGALAEIADEIERERDAEVADSPYDAILPEDRNAAAWVREHGGLDAVERRWDCLSYYADPVPRSCMERRLARLQRQIDESHAALRRRNQRIEELGHRVGDLTTENAELRKRAMPEGCEWPRYEDGEPVRIGDDVTKYVGGGTIKVRSVEFLENMTYLHERFKTDQIAIVRPGKRVKRPVLAADGEPLEVWQTVWGIGRSQHEFEVLALNDVNPEVGNRFNVKCFDRDDDEECWCDPKLLTHTKPELPKRCRDCRHWQGDPSASHMGVCFNSYRERCCVDSYAAQLDYAKACDDFEERGE